MANEKRLIDANDALEVLCNYCGVEGCCPEGGCAEYQKISQLPTVDAVEVVRCKDCKNRYWSVLAEYYSCKKTEGLRGMVADDCFCSYGERK